MTDLKKYKLTAIDKSGLTYTIRKHLELVYGPGHWEKATLGSHDGEVFFADDGVCVFATSEHVASALHLNSADIVMAAQNREKALYLASQCWVRPNTKQIPIEPALVEEVARVIETLLDEKDETVRTFMQS